MSLLNRSPQTKIVQENITESLIQTNSSSYVGAHPVLHYNRVSTTWKPDHLENYVETHPFEHTEDGLSDWWYKKKDKVVEKVVEKATGGGFDTCCFKRL